MRRLDAVDLERSLSREEQDEQLAALGKRLLGLRLALGGILQQGDPQDPELGPALLVLVEGWDAAGKGGAIRRLVAPLDPRHVRVVSFAAPTADELRHHYLHRFATALPGHGGMAILDRTYYGRVLVERVEGLASRDQWQRAYGEIRGLERSLAAERTIVVKLWLHISDAEQLERFERRRDDPLKRWKLTAEDWRNRDRRAAYEDAVEEMLDQTDIPEARWHVIAADSKRYARVSVMRTVIEEIERGCRAHGFRLPDPLD